MPDQARAACGRWWILTISIAAYPDWQPNLPDGVVYAKGQQEEGAGGFHHWQLVVCFQSNQRRAAVVRAFPGAHAELTRSQAAVAYVWKDDTAVGGTRFELGSLPFKRNSKVDWARQLELVKEGKLEEVDPGVMIRNYASITRIAAANYVPVVREMPVVKVYWGRTGAGKSYTALREAQGDKPDLRDVYFKSGTNKWWDGYRGQTNVVVEEFDGFIHITHLLKWFDRIPCGVEIKGGTVPLRAIKFWVTSNVAPEDWWGRVDGKGPTDEQMAALRRRIQVTHFERQWVPEQQE